VTTHILAYLAGVMDSDGCFTIIRNTYAQRVRGDAKCPVYQESASIKQVEPQAIELLKPRYGGCCYLEHPEKGRPLYKWEGRNRVAIALVRDLLPYLRIKRKQAELLLALRATKDDARLRQAAHWYGPADPKKPAYLLTEAAALKNTSPESIRQAIRNGSVPAFKKKGRVFVPCDFWDKWDAKTTGRSRPAELVTLREGYYTEIGKLNSPLGKPFRHRAKMV
jgi:hypothetical protein